MEKKINFHEMYADFAKVFDADYYASSYGEEIPPDSNPLEHFLRVGLPRGYKPAPQIDPLLFRLVHPTTSAQSIDQNVWRAFVSDSSGGKPIELLSQSIPKLPIRPSADPACTRTFSSADAVQYGQSSHVEFTIKRKTYRLHTPTANFVMSRLRKNLPCAIVRLSHGDWDCLTLFHRYRPSIAEVAQCAQFDDDQIDLLTARLCEEYHHSQQMFSEHFLRELISDLSHHLPRDNFIYSLAFKGYPTADERLFEWSINPSELDKIRFHLVARFFSTEEYLLDATIWKRWLTAGSLREFPDVVRARPVILVGADALSQLGTRWNIPHFIHVKIPSSYGYDFRHNILGECRKAISEAKKISRIYGMPHPVFLTQGSSFAYWLIRRLFTTDPDVFYFDLGQALHAWFFDREEIPLLNWGKYLGPAIVRNMGLEDYYGRLGVLGDPATTLFPADRR